MTARIYTSHQSAHVDKAAKTPTNSVQCSQLELSRVSVVPLAYSLSSDCLITLHYLLMVDMNLHLITLPSN